jgi:hypothetical protein
MNVSQAVGSGGANKAATMFQKPPRSAQRKLLNSHTRKSSYAAFQKQSFSNALGLFAALRFQYPLYR